MPKYNKVKKSYDSDNNVSSDESEYLESSDESENIKTKIKKSKNKGKKDKDTDKKGKSVLSKKFLANQFPSKHANKVVKDEKKLKNKMILRSNEKKNKKNKKSSRVEELDEDVEEYYNDEVHVEEDDESEEYETDEEDSDEEDSDEEDSDEEDSDEEDSDEEDSDEEEYEEDSEEYVNQHEKDGIVNIVLALDGLEDDDEEYYEDDDAECNSEDEETFMKEKYEKINIKLNEKQKQKKEREIKKKENKLKKEEPTDAEVEYLDLVSTKKHYLHQLEKRPNSKTIKGLLDDINIRIKKLVKKTRSKNAKMYHKLVHKEKKRTNEIDYFKKKLSNKEQLKVMRDLKEINSHINIDKPYRLSLLDSDMPAKFKAIAMQKLNILKWM